MHQRVGPSGLPSSLAGHTPRSASLVPAPIVSASIDDPSSIFNLASLKISVPSVPLDRDRTLPRSSSLSLLDEGSEKETDGWVQEVVNEEEREDAYYDEHLPFYLTLHLPPCTPPLTRSQAHHFLLPSPSLSPSHLALSAELSYVEGSHPHQPSPHYRSPPSNSLLSSGHGNGETPNTPSPLPATRFSDQAYVDAPSVSVWSYPFVADDGLSTAAKEEGEGENDGSSGGKGKGKDKRNFGLGKVWVGKVTSRSGEDHWVGVWEFKGDVAFVSSHLQIPKLCLTVTLTFRDDPRLVELLELAGLEAGVDANKDEEENDDDEYLIESFDDVNLLSPLYPPLHLPASRLPLPPALTTPLDRRESLSYRRPSLAHRHSLSLPSLPSSPDPSSSSSPPSSETPFIFPSIRRSFRRVLTVKSALSVRLRTVACPVSFFESGGEMGESGWNEGLLEENEGMGMGMCVEVCSVGEVGDEWGFEVEEVRVEVGGGGKRGERVEIREVGRTGKGKDEKWTLRGADQQNFVYALSYAFGGMDDLLSFEGGKKEDDELPPAVPIFVATSPSQRFNERFEDFMESNSPGGGNGGGEWNGGVEGGRRRRSSVPPPVPTKVDKTWIRNVAITVVGRPIRVALAGAGAKTNGRSLTGGYIVPNGLSTSRGGEKVGDSPTDPFASRWNCTLDLSPCAVPAHFRHAIPFHPPYLPSHPTTSYSFPPQSSSNRRPPPPPILPPPPNRTSLASSSATSNPITAGFKRSSLPSSQPPLPQLEAIAGSKRHTISSLASLAQKSPTLTREKTLPRLGVSPTDTNNQQTPTQTTFASPFKRPLSNELPPITPGATGPPKRFFSLPSTSSSSLNAPPTSSSTKPSLPAPSKPSTKFTLPPTSESPQHHRTRTSSSSTTGLAASSTSTGMTRTLSEGKRASWNRAESAFGGGSNGVGVVGGGGKGLGLGMGSFGDGQGENYPPESEMGDEEDAYYKQERGVEYAGGILVSVALLPLRAVGGGGIEGVGGGEKYKGKAIRVGLLDVFLVEVFVVNQSESVKRFTVGVPNNNGRRKEADRVATLIPLENDIRIGPLAPYTCHSVRLRFLAVRPGAHRVEELRLVDQATGFETLLVNPVQVVVEP